MHSFKDSQGRNWDVALTIGAVRRVRDLVDVNLLELEKGEPPLITRIGMDVILLCDVIYAICKPQADDRKVTDEQFGEALGGDAILAAQEAFYGELVDFFRRQHRLEIARAVEKQQAMIAAAVTALDKRIEAIDPEAETEKIIAEAEKALATPGSSSGSSPASSASTPAPSPSAS